MRIANGELSPVGRRYAGLLGSLAFATTLFHGVLHNAGVQATVGRATAALAVFAVIGGILGLIAERTVEESVRTTLAEKLAQRKASEQSHNRAA